MARDQALLMRRMAIQHNNRINRRSTEEENDRIMPYAFGAMIYTATLNRYLYDLYEVAMQDVKNPQKEKRMMCKIQQRAMFAHQAIYKAFEQAYKGFGQYYNAEHDRAVEIIESHVLIEGASRVYSIVLALFELVEEMNSKCGRWRCPAIVALEPTKRWLKDLKLPYEDKSSIVRVIIEKAYKVKLPHHYEKNIISSECDDSTLQN